MPRELAVGLCMTCFVISQTAIAKKPLTLMSTEIARGKTLNIEQVYKGFGCSGKNISPALQWENAPKDTKSFALTVYDPDAPTGSGWWHWVIIDIPAHVTELKSNAGNPKSTSAPKGSLQLRTDFGANGYGGACPPKGHGQHRYRFTLFALDTPKLQVAKDATAAMVGFMINSHKIAESTIEAVYQR